MCGSQSETQSPLWPCCFHLRCEASSGESPSPIGVITGSKLAGSGLPASWSSSRLGVEQVDVARPALHEQEDDALGRRRRECGRSGARAPATAEPVAGAGAPAVARQQVRRGPGAPKPRAGLRSSQSRRVERGHRDAGSVAAIVGLVIADGSMAGLASVDVQELVGVQQAWQKSTERLAVGRGRSRPARSRSAWLRAGTRRPRAARRRRARGRRPAG